jgi:hypothetical protein
LDENLFLTLGTAAILHTLGGLARFPQESEESDIILSFR